MIRWLGADDGPDKLPPPEEALDEPNGLLAVGGCLEPEWLLASYARGIFPWFEAGQPILWWSPNPRAVLVPDHLHVTRSLRKTVRAKKYRVTADTAFERVIEACAGPRSYTSSTWITPEMAAAYVTMHELGWAHSFEAWQEDELAGGLYGIAIGRVFFGESMFARFRDASKVAFVHAVGFLRQTGIELIDCQISSHHLRRLGATDLPRAKFLRELERLTRPRMRGALWTQSFDAYIQRLSAAT